MEGGRAPLEAEDQAARIRRARGAAREGPRTGRQERGLGVRQDGRMEPGGFFLRTGRESELSGLARGGEEQRQSSSGSGSGGSTEQSRAEQSRAEQSRAATTAAAGSARMAAGGVPDGEGRGVWGGCICRSLWREVGSNCVQGIKAMLE